MPKKSKIKPRKKANIKKELDNINIREDVFLKSSFSIFEVSIITLIAILFGIVIGYLINYSKDASHNKNLNKIITTYADIVDDYYGKVDENKLSNAAIKGMIDSLDDPYSNYMEGNIADEFNQMVDGKYVGIGVVVSYSEEGNIVKEVTENGPAEKAGIKVDDIIVKVNDVDVTNYLGDELVTLIRGKAGSKVKITVSRDNKNLDFNIKRASIDLDSVSKEVYEAGDALVGYIRISAFASNTAAQFKDALVELEKEKVDSLIIDVRNNPGGHLSQARKILSNFFEKDTVLYQIESKGKKKKIYSTTSDTRKYPVAVLINGSSASAAEVLASCFKDNYKNAIIVGETSYGKGTIQKSERLGSGASIKYTTDKWLTSKGKWLNEKGVKPDYEVIADYGLEIDFENDEQLQTALSKIGIVNEIKEVE